MVGVLSKQRRPAPAAPCPVNGSATVAGNGEGENPNCHRPLVGHSRFKIHFPMGSWGGGRGLGGSGIRRMRGSRSGDPEHCSGAAARGCFPHIEPRRGVPRDHAAMAGRASPTMANPRAPVPVFSQVGSAPPSTQARTHARGEAISPFRSLAPPARGPPRPQRAAVAAPVLPASATCRDSSSRVATTRKLTPA